MRSLAVSQLQTQVSRSAALDAGALGVMTVDAAIASIILNIGATHQLWIPAMALLGLSLGWAIRALRLEGAEQTGPLITAVLEARGTGKDRQLEELLLEDLAADMLANRRALARKAPLFTRAQTLLVLAVIVELAGLVVP